MPTVSIIIPNYNHSLFLKQRIDTVLAQSYQDFEVIILDDCSKDNSREIIECYRHHPKISQIIYNDTNSGGVFKQWIKGIHLSKGEYIWIAESDDYSTEDFLKETVAVLDTTKNAGMVFTASTTVDENGDFITTTEQIKKAHFLALAKADNKIDNNNLSDFLIGDFLIENASSVLFRKSNLLALDFVELSQFKNTGDRFVYIGIALKSSIQYLPKFCNYMRSHTSNTTKKSTENGNLYKDRIRVLNYYYKEIEKSIGNLQPIADLYRKDYFFFLNFCTYEENIQLLDQIKQTNTISSMDYLLMKYYLILFKKKNYQLRLLRSLYYRILVLKLGH